MDKHQSKSESLGKSNERGAPLKNILKDDPAVVLKNSIEKEDFRFLAIGGFGAEVPIENPDGTIERYLKDDRYLKFGINVLISAEYYDSNLGIPIEEYKQLIEPSRNFSAKYNRLLLKYLDEQKAKEKKSKQ